MSAGLIHSTESFGAVDGPGIRFVVFVKGCRMRCAYCHNVDTWDPEGAERRTPAEILEEAERYRAYWGKKGGITVSGGEPLLQLPFLTDLFRMAKERGISTVLDTAGEPFTRKDPVFSEVRTLLSFTDLVLLDIKEMDAAKHRQLTGCGNENILDFARYLSEIEKPVWIRHVLVPGVSDFDEDLRALRGFLDTLTNVERIEVLPYHGYGEEKWEKLGIPYRLSGTKPPDEERIRNAERILRGMTRNGL